MVEERLGERRALGRVGPGAELIEQDQRVRAGRLDDPGDRPEMARERREALGHRLFVADIGEDVLEDRQPRPGLGRDVQPGLVHQREEAKRPQGHGLAAGIRTGDHERGVAVAQPDIDRHDAAGQPRVTRPEQDDLRPVCGLGPGRVHLGRQARLGGPQVEARERAERLTQLDGVRGDERRQLVEDPLDLLALGRLGLAPGVPELDRDERFDEQGLTAARRVVDDALDPAARLGLDRDHIAAVPQRDERLLERPARRLGLDEGLEAPAQPVVGDPYRGPQPAETRRRAVEQLADRVEAPRERASEPR